MIHLSYTPRVCLHRVMPFPDPFSDDDEPEWKRTAVAIEFWILTLLVGGALIYGLLLSVVSLAGFLGSS